MNIRKATIYDFKYIHILYEDAREFMKNNGNPNQWGSNYPPDDIVTEDIYNGNCYVCMKNNNIIGTFFFKVGIEPTYNNIFDGKWLNDEPYGIIHRITTDGSVKGTATFCLKWCFSQCNNIRIDTHDDNIPMQNLLEKNGFIRCGYIYTETNQKLIAYQKVPL